MSKKHKTNEGICNLTGKFGKYIKSHIIPMALTRPSIAGNGFIQIGFKQKRKLRWSSWYDQTLVTAEGEKILTDLDTWAIQELRSNKLVWSGWGTEKALDKELYKSVGNFGIRVINGIDPIRLRLFFLSILWRMAATSMDEFRYVALPNDDLECLKLMLIKGNPEPISFYPTLLTQIVTKGFAHNHAGSIMEMQLPDLDKNDGTTIAVPIFRLYFDGLIIHIYMHLPKSYSVQNLRGLLVGSSEHLVMTTVKFKNSLQFRSMQDAIFGGH